MQNYHNHTYFKKYTRYDFFSEKQYSLYPTVQQLLFEMEKKRWFLVVLGIIYIYSNIGMLCTYVCFMCM